MAFRVFAQRKSIPNVGQHLRSRQTSGFPECVETDDKRLQLQLHNSFRIRRRTLPRHGTFQIYWYATCHFFRGVIFHDAYLQPFLPLDNRLHCLYGGLFSQDDPMALDTHGNITHHILCCRCLNQLSLQVWNPLQANPPALLYPCCTKKKKKKL